MTSIFTTSVVEWLAEKFEVSRFLSEPDILDWVFQPLRVLAVLFLLIFTALATRRAGGKASWRRYATCAFIVYAGVAVGLIVMVGYGVTCCLVTDIPEKTELAAKFGTLMWVLELFFWWSLILIVYGIGHLRFLLAIRKDTTDA